jgi:ribosomal-protein-alanine N-acetyltransferase
LIDKSMINPYQIGSLVYLRHPTQEDANGGWHEWFSDEEVTKYLDSQQWPNSQERQQEYLKTANSSSNITLSVVSKSSDKHIGVVSLRSMNLIHRSANVSIVMGEREFRGGAHSLDAFSLILRVAFLRFNLRNLVSYYAEPNEASRLLHRVFKFCAAGVLSDSMFIDGRWENVIIEVLKQDVWLKRNKVT